jgi:recombinational DNA repair ATPase RecF
MILYAATISGFKSFRKPVSVFFSPRTSILIGPNDHGKTNVLLAIEKLGIDKEFTSQEINDRSVREGKIAQMTYQIQVSEAEIHTIEAGIQSLLDQEAKSERQTISELMTSVRLDSTETFESPDAAETTEAAETPDTPTTGGRFKDLFGNHPLRQWWRASQRSK